MHTHMHTHMHARSHARTHTHTRTHAPLALQASHSARTYPPTHPKGKGAMVFVTKGVAHDGWIALPARRLLDRWVALDLIMHTGWV